ncbi:hypothetical protein OQA88_11810 [Cercophora sp. LCS_1]
MASDLPEDYQRSTTNLMTAGVPEGTPTPERRPSKTKRICPFAEKTWPKGSLGWKRQQQVKVKEKEDDKSSLDEEPGVAEIEEVKETEPPYHVFSRRKKWQLVIIVSLAGLFSPLSSNIYFPALGAIAEETHTSIALISLTVTVYMAVQGIAPSFWGPLSDIRGRRITFIGTLSVYLIANIGLALSKTFPALMVFRAIQAAGSAATISVGAGVIGDMTTSKERGTFVGSFGGIRMLGQSLGPVIGGIITEYLGFHAIFWFLFILGSLTLLSIIFFLPETLRRIAGDGTVPLAGINRPVFPGSIQKHWTPHPPRPPAEPITLSLIFSPLRFLFEKDVFCTLVFGAVVYTAWSMVTSSTTALFQPRFGLSNLQTGLIFLPNGAACVLGSYLTGKILDRDFKLLSLQSDGPPIIRARLRSSFYLVPTFALAVGCYGFSIDSPLLLGQGKKGMVVPLMLQFVIAFTATAVFTANSALMVDLYPGKSASATATSIFVLAFSFPSGETKNYSGQIFDASVIRSKWLNFPLWEVVS